MAKKSSVNHNNLRKELSKSKEKTRDSLKSVIMNKTTSFEDRMSSVIKLSQMPRNSSKVRYRNRCALTGRPRGYYRKFCVSRIALRDLGSAGFLPGLLKSSW
jgi:small subunit ribosomal protein S14